MRNLLTSVTLIVVSSVAVASAADLPSKKTAPAAPVATLYKWSGPYVGVIGGYSLSGQLTGSDANAIRSDIPDTKGFFGGLNAGYNFQSGAWVYGPEFDLALSAADGKKTSTFAIGSATNKVEQKAFGSGRLRVGYAFDNILVFATGGAAGTSLKLGYSESGVGFLDSSSYTKTIYGYTVGAGVEYGVTNNITTRLEYRYASYQDQRFGDNKYGFDTHDIRAGLAYKF